MIIETIQIRELTAGPGMVLTNGEVYSKTVFLSNIDSPENWWEVPEEEAENADTNREDED